jgi:hypothetical protein
MKMYSNEKEEKLYHGGGGRKQLRDACSWKKDRKQSSG